MKITIELNDTYEYEGKQYTPTGEYRAPKYGEIFIGSRGYTVKASSGFHSEERRFILKPKRWRAERHCKYWFVQAYGDISQVGEEKSKGDNKRYELGNYFQTKEQAEAARDKIKKLLLSLGLED